MSCVGAVIEEPRFAGESEADFADDFADGGADVVGLLVNSRCTSYEKLCEMAAADDFPDKLIDF